MFHWNSARGRTVGGGGGRGTFVRARLFPVPPRKRKSGRPERDDGERDGRTAAHCFFLSCFSDGNGVSRAGATAGPGIRAKTPKTRGDPARTRVNADPRPCTYVPRGLPRSRNADLLCFARLLPLVICSDPGFSGARPSGAAAMAGPKKTNNIAGRTDIRVHGSHPIILTSFRTAGTRGFSL